MSANIKFRCKLTDLADAVQKHCGISGTVIESGHDIEGLVNSLLGVIESQYVVIYDSKNCKVDGEDAIITLHSKSDLSLTNSHLYEEKEREVLVRQYFLEEVRRLQSMLNPK